MTPDTCSIVYKTSRVRERPDVSPELLVDELQRTKICRGALGLVGPHVAAQAHGFEQLAHVGRRDGLGAGSELTLDPFYDALIAHPAIIAGQGLIPKLSTTAARVGSP